MPTVFIANKSFHDYTRASQFGNLVSLTVGNVDLKATDRLEERIQHGLRNSEPDDILLLGGAPIIATLAQAYLMRKHGAVNVLYHDPGRADYVLRKFIDGNERRIKPELGSILCPNCDRVIAEAPADVIAYSTEPCELCLAEKEEENEGKDQHLGMRKSM